jgi:hypothetical protein
VAINEELDLPWTGVLTNTLVQRLPLVILGDLRLGLRVDNYIGGIDFPLD